MIKRKIIMCVCENNNNSSKCKKSNLIFIKYISIYTAFERSTTYEYIK